jgi:hypothetical protein
MKRSAKPMVALFLGYVSPVNRDENVWFARTLDEAHRFSTAFHCVNYLQAHRLSRWLGNKGQYLALCILLGYVSPVNRDENVWFARTLDEAGRLACLLARVVRLTGET